MSEQTLETIFDRYSQADEGKTKSYQGTGLGLAIVKEIVDLMSGEIFVESRLGEGTKFTVRCPLKVDRGREDTDRDNASLSPDSDSTLTRRSDLSGIAILCVDDSNINLKVLSRPLIKAGAEVTSALTAKEALDLIRASAVDVVLTDISMPEMDGEQLQRELQQWKVDLPVIAVTGNVLEEDVKRYLTNGFVAALSKPVDLDKLFAVIDACVSPDSATA